jgi:hypothetical protein
VALVQIDQGVQGTLADVKSRKTRQEVITDEEAEEDEVIDYTLEVEGDLMSDL